MTSGYRMTEQAFRRGCVEGFDEPERPAPWDFLQVERGMRVPNREYRHVERLLAVSPSQAFKVWMLSKWLKALAAVLGVAAAAAVVYAFFNWSDLPVVRALTLGSVGLAVLSYLMTKVATMVLGEKLLQAVQLRATLTRVALGVGLAAVGWLAAGVHLVIFDRLFLKLGSIERFNKLAASGAEAQESAPKPAAAK